MLNLLRGITNTSYIIDKYEDAEYYNNLAVAKNDLTICSKLRPSFERRIGGGTIEGYESGCISNFAFVTKNIEICFKNKGSFIGGCIENYAIKTKDFQICNQLDDPRAISGLTINKKDCLNNISKDPLTWEKYLTPNPTLCLDLFNYHKPSDYANKDESFLYKCLHEQLPKFDFKAYVPKFFSIDGIDINDKEISGMFRYVSSQFIINNKKIVGQITHYNGVNIFFLGKEAEEYKEINAKITEGLVTGNFFKRIPYTGYSKISNYKIEEYLPKFNKVKTTLYKIKTRDIDNRLSNTQYDIFFKGDTMIVIGVQNSFNESPDWNTEKDKAIYKIVDAVLWSDDVIKQ
jgi:hypothetical protein